MPAQIAPDARRKSAYGSSILIDAVNNPATTPALLVRLCSSKQTDINHVCKPRTRKWQLIDIAAETVYKRNLVHKSDLLMTIAFNRGSTPLHQAAYNGHLSLVVWLLLSLANAPCVLLILFLLSLPCLLLCRSPVAFAAIAHLSGV